MGEWRIANPHQTSTLENRRFVNMVDIREYDDRPGSRYVCEATPEDAERIVSAVSRAAALEAQVARYRAGLIRYGAHTDINCTWGTDGSYVCACGLYGIVDQQEFEEALATGGPGGGVVGES